jgi:hypothetical protein
MSKYMLFICSIIWMTSCDPGLHGDLKIYNETNEVLTAKYKDYYNDTTYKDIQPNSSETIKNLGGLGSNKNFDCCPCEMKAIFIKSSTGQIKKDPANSENWSIPNKGKLKKFGGQDVKCEFHVTQADL